MEESTSTPQPALELAAGEPDVEAPIAAVETPSEEITSEEPEVGGAAHLSVERGWDTRHSGGKMVMEEFMTLLDGITPDPSLDFEPGMEIYRRIKLMMPVEEAIAAVGIANHARLARSKVVVGGWPNESTFFHSFDYRSDPPFNRLNLVTDAASRVIAVQLVNEAPTSSTSPNRPQTWGVYDYVNLKRKGANYTGVRIDVSQSGTVLLINSWFINPRSSPQDLETVRLYLPQRIAQTIRHCLGNALGK